MRWFVDITPIASGAAPLRLCVEGSHWQAALQRARGLRGEPEKLAGLSVDFLEDGCRAFDATLRERYMVKRAPDDALLSEPPASATDEASTGPRSSRDRSGPKSSRPARSADDEPPPLPAVRPEARASQVAAEPESAQARASRRRPKTMAFASEGTARTAEPEPSGKSRKRPRTMAFGSVGQAESRDGAAQAASAEAQAAATPPSAARMPLSAPPRASEGAPPSRGGAAMLDETLPSAGSDLVYELLSARQVEPTGDSPLSYREYVYGLSGPLPSDKLERFMRERLAEAREALQGVAAGKVVNIALFDHIFHGRPERPPVVTLAWKDWRGEEPEIVLAPFRARPSKAHGAAPPGARPSARQSARPPIPSVPPDPTPQLRSSPPPGWQPTPPSASKPPPFSQPPGPPPSQPRPQPAPRPSSPAPPSQPRPLPAPRPSSPAPPSQPRPLPAPRPSSPAPPSQPRPFSQPPGPPPSQPRPLSQPPAPTGKAASLPPAPLSQPRPFSYPPIPAAGRPASIPPPPRAPDIEMLGETPILLAKPASSPPPRPEPAPASQPRPLPPPRASSRPSSPTGSQPGAGAVSPGPPSSQRARFSEPPVPLTRPASTAPPRPVSVPPSRPASVPPSRPSAPPLALPDRGSRPSAPPLALPDRGSRPSAISQPPVPSEGPTVPLPPVQIAPVTLPSHSLVSPPESPVSRRRSRRQITGKRQAPGELEFAPAAPSPMPWVGPPQTPLMVPPSSAVPQAPAPPAAEPAPVAAPQELAPVVAPQVFAPVAAPQVFAPVAAPQVFAPAPAPQAAAPAPVVAQQPFAPASAPQAAPTPSGAQPFTATPSARGLVPESPVAFPPPAAPPAPVLSPEERARALVPRPTAPKGPRLEGDELLTDMFEAMAELHFLGDALEGADFVLAQAMEKLPCEVGLVSLFDMAHREYVVVRQAGGKRSGVLLRLPQHAKLPQTAMRYSRAVIVAEPSRHRDQIDRRWREIGVTLHSLVCAPVELEGRYLGLIELGNPHDGRPFCESDGHALTYIGRQFAEFVADRGVVTDPERVLEGLEAETQ